MPFLISGKREPTGCAVTSRRIKFQQSMLRCGYFIFLTFTYLAEGTPVLAQGGNFLAALNYAVPGPGQGAFRAPSQGAVAIADFDGNKKPDIVIANYDNTVSVLLGNGDGTFQPGFTVTAVPSSSTFVTVSVAVGDFNGDGFPDLAVLCVSSLNFTTPSSVHGTVNILLNKADGTGTFGAPAVTTLDTTKETGSATILAAQFGADTHTDLAVLETGSQDVSILRGNGNGTFQTAVDYPTGSQPAGLAIGDLNRDGNFDLAVAGMTSTGDGVVSVLLGNKDGTFGTAVSWITSGSSCTQFCTPPTTVVIGDFNGDGMPDLAVNDGVVGGIFVLLGDGHGSFREPPLHSANAASPVPGQVYLQAGDFNSDGRLDLAMAVGGGYPNTPDDLFLYLGNGDGTFPFPLELNFGTGGFFQSSTAIAIADLNGDKFPDIVLATNTGAYMGAVSVVLNCGLKCSNTALSSSTATSAFNQPITFTATVTPGNAKATGTPTGSVVFQDSAAGSLGSATLSGGIATFVDPSLAIGTHTISAVYQGDRNFVSSASSTITQTVTTAPTSTAINSSPDPSSPGQSVTFTAKVTPSTSGVPTGNVTFSDSNNPSVAVPLDSSGSASFTTSTLTTGVHSLTWSYSGDSNFQMSTSPVLTQIVGTNPAPFAMSSSASSATVSAGQAAVFSITVVSVPSLKAAISFSCSGLPSMATCQFNPPSVNAQGSPAETKLTIATARSSALLKTPQQIPPQRIPFMMLLSCALLAVLLQAPLRSAPGRQPAFLGSYALVLLLAMTAAMIACGGGSSSHPSTPTGTLQVVVTGSSGMATQSFTLTLTVN